MRTYDFSPLWRSTIGFDRLFDLAEAAADLGAVGFAVWATKRDPQMLRILLTSSQARRRYDPGKHQSVVVEVTPW